MRMNTFNKIKVVFYSILYFSLAIFHYNHEIDIENEHNIIFSIGLKYCFIAMYSGAAVLSLTVTYMSKSIWATFLAVDYLETEVTEIKLVSIKKSFELSYFLIDFIIVSSIWIDI